MVVSNTGVSCEIYDRWRYRLSSFNLSISVPSTNICPEDVFRSPSISLMMVDFPLPLAPITAVEQPGLMEKVTWRRIFRSPYPKETSTKSIFPRTCSTSMPASKWRSSGPFKKPSNRLYDTPFSLYSTYSTLNMAMGE
ncbi:hypothetical protein D3C75_1039960 [compost metagenome]